MNNPGDVNGITFLELVIITACLALLSMVVLPALKAHQGSKMFPELVNAAATRKEAIRQAVIDKRALTLDELDAGNLGIPADVAPSSTHHGAKVSNGVITMTWRLDSTFLEGTTYQLNLVQPTTPLEWEAGGSCLARRVC